jgi:hypothetical protein
MISEAWKKTGFLFGQPNWFLTPENSNGKTTNTFWPMKILRKLHRLRGKRNYLEEDSSFKMATAMVDQ